MMDTPSTFGLRFDQLAGLLSVGSADPASDDSQGTGDTADALETQLRGELPSKSILLGSILETMGRLGCDVRAMSGRSLMDILLNAKTDVALLQTIKDHAKGIIAGSIARTEISVATAIYFAAIASAMVFHEKRITDNNREKLAESFAMLLGKSWVPPDLAMLYSRAKSLCDGPGEDE